MAEVQVPHFAFPLRLNGSGSFAVVEQDSADDVVQCVEVLLRTPVGSREELPEYGIDDPTFIIATDIGGILDSIEAWEPRAQVDIDVEIDNKDELMRHIHAAVSNNGVVQ